MPSLFLMVLAYDLNPHKVSHALGFRPSQWWCRGEKRIYNSDCRKRPQQTTVHKLGGWKHYFGASKNETGLIRKMTRVAAELNGRRPKLRALLESGHEIYLVTLVQDVSSIVLPPELHEHLGRLGIHLRIDFWPP